MQGPKEGNSAVLGHGGCQLSVSGSLIVRSKVAGLAVAGEGSHLEAVGVLVRDTVASDGANLLGVGIVAGEGTSCRVVASLLQNNRVAGIALWAKTATLAGVVVAGTQPGLIRSGGGQILVSDGLLAVSGAKVEVVSSLFTGHERAGLLIRNVADARLHRVVALGGQFGLASENKGAAVELSLLVGTVANHSSDTGLATPTPPKFVPVSALP